MTRIIRSVGLALALATAGLCGSAFTWTAGWAAAAQKGTGTPLPPGWELCVLQGVSAPATQANVADLDEWQTVEGGSTNNTAAYNPFNTRRTTDVSGASLPAVVSANGFPAFTTWQAGCAATVATVLQPNMSSITAALRAGNVAPPGAFLAVVDQSSWCAASADGVPCYANVILGAAGNVQGLPTASLALDVYGNVKSDLRSYQQAIAAVAADQEEIATRDEQLAAAQSQLSAAQSQLDTASRALRQFAIDEYVSSGLYTSASLAMPATPVTPFGPQNADGVVAQQYLSVAATNLIGRDQAAASAVKASLAGRDGAAQAVTQAGATLVSDDAAERRSLAQMVSDVATMQNAGACTTVTIAAPTPSAPAPTGPSATVPSTTVPTTNAPTTSTTTSTTSTTTTSTTTTTTTTLPTIPATSGTVPSTTSTSTVPTTTVPSTVPTSTVSTTTVPSTSVSGSPSTGSPQNANPAGVTALQGCVAALAPPGGP